MTKSQKRSLSEETLTAPNAEMRPRLVLLTSEPPGIHSGDSVDKHATRVHKSLLAQVEKRALVWLAARMPARVNSDHLTLLGLVAMFFAGASYSLARWWPASLLLVNLWLAVNWFGDSLDGTLARVRRKERPRYGYYVDHVIDSVGALFMLAGLALSGLMTPIVAASLLVGFYLLSINVYLGAYCLRVFNLSFWKFGPTELRILLAIGNVFALSHQWVHVLGGRYLFFDVAGVIAAAGMFVVFVISVLRTTLKLYQMERV